jgi:hypothetical protein
LLNEADHHRGGPHRRHIDKAGPIGDDMGHRVALNNGKALAVDEAGEKGWPGLIRCFPGAWRSASGDARGLWIAPQGQKILEECGEQRPFPASRARRAADQVEM